MARPRAPLWSKTSCLAARVLILGISLQFGDLFFAADSDNSDNNIELWKTNGTESGTVLVKEITGESYLTDMSEAGGALFLAISDGTGSNALWKSDGTTSGTVRIKDIAGEYLADPTEVDGRLFFVAEQGDGYELWKSDGTPTGTALVKDIPISGGHGPHNLVSAGETLFFVSAYQNELWKSDGTAGGTVKVKDDVSASSWSMTSVGPSLFFTSDGLWKTDGTPAGTVEVKRPVSARGYSYPSDLTAVGGSLFFINDFDELWKSDGSAAGTVLVKEITGAAGVVGGYQQGGLANVQGTLFFTANDGTELWRSDGSSTGTVVVNDSAPGAADPDPTNISYPSPVGGTLFFMADDGVHGRELWKVDASTAADTTPPETRIVSGPAEGSAIEEGRATFGFEGTTGDTARLECSLDGSAFSTCTSPHAFTGLSEGEHTVAFRAVDDAGNADPSPASRTFTVKLPVSENDFTLPRAGTRVMKKGWLTLQVGLPGAGTLKVAPVRKSPVRRVLVSVTSAGSAEVTLKPTRAGLRRLRKQLRRGVRVAKLRVVARFTYRPSSGEANTKRGVYTLKKR